MSDWMYCGECGDRLEGDDDHVRVDAELVQIGDRNEHDQYVFCPTCWFDVSEDWGDPA